MLNVLFFYLPEHKFVTTNNCSMGTYHCGFTVVDLAGDGVGTTHTYPCLGATPSSELWSVSL